jgi:hypothetical protein
MKEYKVKDYGNWIEWYLNGALHREDGPAVEYTNGTKYWFLNGKCHRENGPAVELSNGSKFWYINGKRHRENGPAVEYSNGNKSWYLNGENLTEDQFNERMRPVKEMTVEEITKELGYNIKIVKS